ncbi:MAG: hypothetical protein Kow0062_00010 [Acidobacteriota bacterium]|nr:MAG: hypothetical protein D6738_00160 [Acidobacteriota bacterium]
MKQESRLTIGIARCAALVSLASLAALASVSGGEGLAQEPPKSPDQRHDKGVIERIERDREAVMTGQFFTYDPAGRRDPFESLVRAQPVVKGKRPKGIAGMLVTEIDLLGVATDTAGNEIALFRGSDNRGYVLHEGDVVYDARLISIDLRAGTVVFRQEVDDPRRIKPYRDVVKRLRPETGKQAAQEDDEMEEGS